MTLNSPQAPQQESLEPERRSTGLRLPVSRPRATYVLLGVLVFVFVADLIVTQITGERYISIYGAQWNEAVGAGLYWQLLTATFLHAGLSHLAFNCYALYVLGRDTEGFYGPLWFTTIYFVSGLAGSVAWYLLGSNVPSVGASGAIFGLIGAEAAFFLRNRQLFGTYGRQRLTNVAVLLVINLLIGFTIPNINYIAHLGGLVGGFLLGLVLAPRYSVEWSYEGYGPSPQMVDTRTNGVRWLSLAAASAVLLALVLVGNQRWAG